MASEILVSTTNTTSPTQVNDTPSVITEKSEMVRPTTSQTTSRDTARRRLILIRYLNCNLTNLGVHVLQDCRINEEEMIVLSLGLNFCPPPRKSKQFIISDAVEKFTRQVRIKKHFCLTTNR